MPTNPDTLFQEASCFRCNSNASEAELLELALLDRISTAASADATPGLPLTSVQFNDGGVFGGDADLTWNKTTNLLSIVGGISMTAEANETPLTISGYSLTGANAQSMLSLAGTWNTSGTPTAIDLNITDTASNADSRLASFGVGGSPLFSIKKTGAWGNPSAATNASFRINGIVAEVINWGATTYNSIGFLNAQLRTSAGVLNCVFGTQFSDINTVSQSNGTSSQTFLVYDTIASATDYHRVAIKTARATLTSVSGASVTATNIIPDGAVVIGVTTKVTVGLGVTGGTTGYQVGDADPDRWGNITGTAAGTSSDNRDWTATTVQAFTSATSIVITANGGNFDGTGTIYVSVQYIIGQSD